MAFGGLEFSFDNINCSEYGLKLFTIGGSGGGSVSGGAEMTLYTDKPARGYKFNLLGVSEEEPLTFDLSFGTTQPMTRNEISKIQKWLFGHKTYKKLTIIQEDMTKVHYNCILTDSEIELFGNRPMLITCKVICDSPFAWEDEVTYSYNQTSITHDNTSDINDYTYPKIEFTATSSTVSIVNLSNQGRTTEFTNLTVGEIITLDNERQILTSSKGLKRLKNFNKNWFELVPNENIIRVVGANNFSMVYANARRIGG